MTNSKGLIALAAAVVFGTVATAAEAGRPVFRAVAQSDAERYAAGVMNYEPGAAMWIWSDRYVYSPNDAISVRGTIKPNGDFYPYTIVAYRQNNQTGGKTYFPRGTSEPTDVFGNTREQGFRIAQLPEAEKQLLLGDGGLFGPAASAPNELGMHTIVVELRDYTGNKVLKSTYQKISVVDAVEDIQGEITADRTLVNTRSYRLSGVVYVKNATLTIEPGTIIQGQPGSQPPSVLVVTRTARIEANGTRSRPIIMTSSRPFGQRRRGDWGGLMLLGAAPGNMPADNQFIEGLPQNEDTRYGGDDDAHNCGTLRYVRVEFAGAELSPNNEVNSFTFGGCGTGTTLEYLQSHYGFDDAFEWFGGSAPAKYLVGTYAADDYIDTQLGYRGRIQHVLAYQDPADRGNRGIEADNSEFDAAAQPVGASEMWNFTIIGSGVAGQDESNSPGIYLRRGAAGVYNNMVVTNFFSTGAHVDQAPTLGNLSNGSLRMNGILAWGNGTGETPAAPNTVDGQVHADLRSYAADASRNFVAADPMMRRPFEYSDPDFRPTTGSPMYRAGWPAPPDDGFFDQWATWAGAFGEVDWTKEWATFIQESDIRQ